LNNKLKLNPDIGRLNIVAIRGHKLIQTLGIILEWYICLFIHFKIKLLNKLSIV